jgi:hypothetical protein
MMETDFGLLTANRQRNALPLRSVAAEVLLTSNAAKKERQAIESLEGTRARPGAAKQDHRNEKASLNLDWSRPISNLQSSEASLVLCSQIS